jgi:hypothetical protein
MSRSTNSRTTTFLPCRRAGLRAVCRRTRVEAPAEDQCTLQLCIKAAHPRTCVTGALATEVALDRGSSSRVLSTGEPFTQRSAAPFDCWIKREQWISIEMKTTYKRFPRQEQGGLLRPSAPLESSPLWPVRAAGVSHLMADAEPATDVTVHLTIKYIDGHSGVAGGLSCPTVPEINVHTIPR